MKPKIGDYCFGKFLFGSNAICDKFFYGQIISTPSPYETVCHVKNKVDGLTYGILSEEVIMIFPKDNPIVKLLL